MIRSVLNPLVLLVCAAGAWAVGNSSAPGLQFAYSFITPVVSAEVIQTPIGPYRLITVTNATFSGPALNANGSVPAIGYGPVDSQGNVAYTTVLTGKTDEGLGFQLVENGQFSANGTAFSRQNWVLPSNSSYASIVTAFVTCSGSISGANIVGDCYKLTN